MTAFRPSLRQPVQAHLQVLEHFGELQFGVSQLRLYNMSVEQELKKLNYSCLYFRYGVVIESDASQFGNEKFGL